jgi:hypothetical protein
MPLLTELGSALGYRLFAIGHPTIPIPRIPPIFPSPPRNPPSKNQKLHFPLDQITRANIISWSYPDLARLLLGQLNTAHTMDTQTSTATPAKPNGAGLLILGVLSLFLGPLTAIPGLILSKRFRPFTATSSVGYFLCWLFLVLSVACVVFAFGVRVKQQ